MAIDVYWGSGSVYSWRVLLALEHKALAYNSHLLQLAMLEKSGRPTDVTHRELLRDRIKQYVQTHLRDPDLSIHRIALALNCSKRHLHGMFEQEETTLADYMQALRLDACRRDFQSHEHAARSITDIALSWGYNSPAHFPRVFRKQFGATPSEWRARALPPGD